jgi:hypothetical protein
MTALDTERRAQEAQVQHAWSRPAIEATVARCCLPLQRDGGGSWDVAKDA